jgi:hypothetical protein
MEASGISTDVAQIGDDQDIPFSGRRQWTGACF